MTTARRLALLLVCVLAGGGIGLLVQAVAGSPLGWLALPVLLVLAWWRVADPERCVTPPPQPPARGRRAEP